MTHARLFDKIVTNTPESWDFSGFPWKRTSQYSIFEVDEHSDEFRYVTADIDNSPGEHTFTYSWIKRIQNVCMFGRYLIRHQQLFAKDTNSREEIRYTCIPECKIEELARHNVDSRYLQYPNAPFINYELLRNANDALVRVHKSVPYPWVLVCARVSTPPDGKIMSDSEIYPEYVVKFASINREPLTL
ncbi:Hypothetical predicted protein [Cloeon dipterum]|uniref:Uncharacterized protein n=1 Tax=Cloeon dipterum TaxID=197152 RepID=A0A8S1BLA7_9INSE|nr:Hypothetical predicted protein [Cloeon dipterum]